MGEYSCYGDEEVAILPQIYSVDRQPVAEFQGENLLSVVAKRIDPVVDRNTLTAGIEGSPVHLPDGKKGAAR